MGIFHSSLQADCNASPPIPQPEGLGSYTPAYKRTATHLPQSPNRKVGDLSLQPTSRLQRISPNPPPEGWGSFTSAYKQTATHLPQSPNRKVGDLSLQPTSRLQRISPNPPTGRLGIFHSSLQAAEKRLHHRCSHFAACSGISRWLPYTIDPRLHKRSFMVF